MLVIAIRCPKCKDAVYSRAGHDYRSCTCGSVAIDGGFSGYTRITGFIEGGKTIDVEVKATQRELYDDWNKRIDKFGLIKGENGIQRAIKARRKKKS